MALGYSISAKVDLLYNPENIRMLLKKGVALGFVYHERSDISFNLIPVTIDHIVQSAEQAISNNDVYATTAYVQEQTYTELMFMDLERYLGVMFLSMSPEWSKSYIDNDKDVDIQRYCLLFLDLISDCKIITMNIDKD